MIGQILGFLDKIADALNRVAGWFIATLLAVIGVLVVLQVTTRTIGIAVSWSFEAVEFCLIWLVFIGSAYAHRTGDVLALTIITDRVSPRTALVLRIITESALLVFVVTAVQHNWLLIKLSSNEVSPVLEIPMSTAAWSITVSFLLYSLYATLNIGNCLRQLAAPKAQAAS